MYTEIVKIIEGGLTNDHKKVISYSRHLASKLREEGEDKLAKKINSVLKQKKGLPVYQDQLFTAPVDNETRLNIANIVTPPEIELNIKISNSVKDSITEFIQLIKSKNKLNNLGIEVNSSLLLYGPPGTGKTTIAKYISKELDLPIIIARFDSLISSLLGNTSKNIRKLFDYANDRPCILFLDEFDAIAKARNDSQEMGELKRVINSLLQNIDEFTQNNILIAATNHEELLDKAIWRRFENVTEISRPERDEILELINLFFEGISIDFSSEDTKLAILADEFYGLSHSEIKKIINKAISKNIINNKEVFQYEDLLLEIFRYKHKNIQNTEKMMKYLNDHGVSQNSIKDIFNVSIRQVRNILKNQT